MSDLPTHNFRQPPEPIFSPKKKRIEPIFTAEERAIFQPYKELYRREPNSHTRTALLKEKILTDIFNYWANNGTAPKTGEEWAERVKVLLQVSLRDVVRQTMSNTINEEIKNVLSDKNLETSALEVFSQYNVAVKNVINQLTPEEETRLRKTAAEWSEKGNPPEIQR
ncbi:hypothetical protein C0992_010486, partial [Termitomyces sp. T32_za158]